MVTVSSKIMWTQSNTVSNGQRTFWIVSITLFCILFQSSSLQSLTSTRRKPAAREEVVLATKKSNLAVLGVIPNFGFDNTIANYIFLDFLQYFGDDEARSSLGYDLTTSFFESILSHTPDYRQFYLFLSGSSSIYTAKPHKSIELIEMGLKQLSPNLPNDSYYIWRYKGVDELLFLGDSRSAQSSFETAALWASQSHDSESDLIEEVSRQTAQYLVLNPQSKSAQIQAWGSILTTALDETTQKRAIEQIEALGGKVSDSESGQFKISFPIEPLPSLEK